MRLPIRLLLALFGVAIMIAVLSSGSNWGVWDWDHHFALLEIERAAILDHHVIPLWNPFIAGGTFILQHPLSSFLSPDFVLVLLFGAILGGKLLLVLRLVAGLVGAYLLAREIGMAEEAAILSSVVMNASGAWLVHVTYGHLEWSLLGYVPWIILSLLRAIERRSYAWAAGAAVGISVLYLGGGVYLLFGLAFFWGLWTAVHSILERKPRVLVFGLTPFILAGVIAGAKLVPSWELFATHPREAGQGFPLFYGDSDPGWIDLPRALVFTLLRRAEPSPVPEDMLIHDVGRRFTQDDLAARGRLFQDINFGGYVGILPFFLAFVAVIQRPRSSLPWLAGFLIVMLLVLSDAVKRATGLDPWEALRGLPVLSNLRTGGRFLVIAIVPLAVLSGIGLTSMEEGRDGQVSRKRRRFAFLLAAIVAVDLGLRATILGTAFPYPPNDVSPSEEFVTQSESPGGFDLAAVRMRMGFSEGHTNLTGFPRAALPADKGGYRGETFLLSGRGTARLEEIRPNDIFVHVRTDRADRLVINQNWADAWVRVDDTGRVTPFNDRISLDVAGGDELIHLRYQPRLLTAGILLSLFGLALAATAVFFHPQARPTKGSRSRL